MSNDAERHEMEDVLARVEEQLSALADVQRKQAALSAMGTAADDLVEVTVDAQGRLARVVIDESYLAEFDFADLGGYVSQAAQAAVRQVSARAAELMAPIREARRELPSLADMVEGAPDFRTLFSGINPGAPQTTTDTDDGLEDTSYPTVRS